MSAGKKYPIAEHDALDESIWDQRHTLMPAPYKGAMAKYRDGIYVADNLTKDIPTKELFGHGRGIREQSGSFNHDIEVKDPEWVEWDSIERGQKILVSHLGRQIASLGIALLAGFSISRFAEVLTHAGYAQTIDGAFERYGATALAIMDWMRFDLRKGGRGRRSLIIVRKMHEFARRSASSWFEKENAGLPLSQLDMAEVLLGFAAVPMAVMEESMGISLTLDEKKDVVHFWRLIGFVLGIEDKYNPCRSLDEMEACYIDFQAFTPLRLKTQRPCTSELQRTAVEGFGRATGFGGELYRAFVVVVRDNKLVFPDKALRETLKFSDREALPGVESVAKKVISMYKYGFINDVMGRIFIFDHDAKRKQLVSVRTQKRIKFLLRGVGFMMDLLVWRSIGIIVGMRKLIAATILLVASRMIVKRKIGYGL